MARYLHTCYRIGHIDRSVSFYEKLGFEERRRMDIGTEAVNVFMGLPDEDPVLELTYNHGVDSYDLGTGYNHIAILVENLDETLEKLAGDGATVQAELRGATEIGVETFSSVGAPLSEDFTIVLL